jgi:hypothetical protein
MSVEGAAIRRAARRDGQGMRALLEEAILAHGIDKYT